MKKASVVTASLFLAVGLAVSAAAVRNKAPQEVFCFLDIGTHRLPADFIEVNDKTVVGESFVPNFGELFRISVFILKEGADEKAEVVFHLRRAGDKADIVTKKWAVAEITPQRNDFYRVPPDPELKGGFHFSIQFAPISGSKDKEFYFYLESPTAKAGRGVKLGVWKTKYYEALRKGSMYINHRQAGSFLAFRTFNTWRGSGADVVRDIKESLGKDRPFALFYFSGVAAILLGILFLGGFRWR